MTLLDLSAFIEDLPCVSQEGDINALYLKLFKSAFVYSKLDFLLTLGLIILVIIITCSCWAFYGKLYRHRTDQSSVQLELISEFLSDFKASLIGFRSELSAELRDHRNNIEKCVEHVLEGHVHFLEKLITTRATELKKNQEKFVETLDNCVSICLFNRATLQQLEPVRLNLEELRFRLSLIQEITGLITDTVPKGSLQANHREFLNIISRYRLSSYSINGVLTHSRYLLHLSAEKNEVFKI